VCELTRHGFAGEQHGHEMGAVWHCELAFRHTREDIIEVDIEEIVQEIVN
jgi:hypothetical protein